MPGSKFYEEIKKAVIERQVEDVYNKGITLYFPNSKGIEYPFACDGFVDTQTPNGKILKLIIEYKFNENLSNSVARAKVLTQVVFYIKRFEQNGFILPNVCLVGDKDECFVMHTNNLLPYLDEEVDWSVSPSKAHETYPDLVLKISQDANINPFVFMVDERFQFKVVAEKIKDLAENVQRYVRVTEHNLSKIFDYFCKNVLKNKNKLTGHDLVEIFMGVIGDKMNYYQHPSNPNVLVSREKHIHMDGKAFEAFFGYFDRTYTPCETMRLNGIADRLIEDVDRRMKGDFWTPTLFVDYAHKKIEECLGYDWKERYVVWDNCWGTGNLTRDYKFRELYCSTLFESELNIGASYNTEAVKFQFDFLNDVIPLPGEVLSGETKMPSGLMEALQEDNPIVFFLNPPYASAGEYGAKSKKHVAKTKINKWMLDENIGSCAQNLYAQFLYRIIKIKQAYHLSNCYIAVFCPTLFLSGGSFKKFRKVLFEEFAFVDAFQFKASEFADVSDSWGIGFTVLGSKREEECVDEVCRGAGVSPAKVRSTLQDNKGNEVSQATSVINATETATPRQNTEIFKYGIAESNGEEIKIIGYKSVYNADNANVSGKWVKDDVQKTLDTITFTSALNININGGKKKSINFIGTLISDANNVDKNTQHVSIFSAYAEVGHNATYEITPSNFSRCVSLFAARRLISKNWINWADEYLAPNENHPQYKEYENDSIVYSLFESKSNQSSLRNIEYKGKTWNIFNEFFWMTKEEISSLANECHIIETYNDARTANERYVYKLLYTPSTPKHFSVGEPPASQANNAGDSHTLIDAPYPLKMSDTRKLVVNVSERSKDSNDANSPLDIKDFNDLNIHTIVELSPEAQAVLNKACDIVRKTFKYRPMFDSEHPEYQILNWDCGWYQVKALAKEYAKSDYEEFGVLFRHLADKMRPMVYELGFLR